MKKALIVVDYQNDFVIGSLGFPKAKELEQPICDKIEEYLNHQNDVLFTFDSHDSNYLQSKEGKHLPIEHCLNGSEGWKLYGKVAEYEKQAKFVFLKNSYGSFELAEYLKQQQYDTIELCGVVSHICVISNAILAQAALPEAEICIDMNCTAGLSDDLNQKALDIMDGLHMTILNQ